MEITSRTDRERLAARNDDTALVDHTRFGAEQLCRALGDGGSNALKLL
jgi:hypothetical protein